MELLKFLASKRDLSIKHKVMFFDLFCMLFLQNINFSSSMIDSIVDTAAQLVSDPQNSEIVNKSISLFFKFYKQTYIKRKVTIGHVDVNQTRQAHMRGLGVNLLKLLAGIDF